MIIFIVEMLRLCLDLQFLPVVQTFPPGEHRRNVHKSAWGCSQGRAEAEMRLWGWAVAASEPAPIPGVSMARLEHQGQWKVWTGGTG